jgi:hypothetical protein
MKSENFIKKVMESKGSDFPSCFDYHYREKGICSIELKSDANKKNLKQLDPWALVFVAELEEETGITINKICFSLPSSIQNSLELEAFKRRISFLNFNNPNIIFLIKLGDKILELYSQDQLFNRPSNEILRNEIVKRNDEDEPGRLEKDLQAFLFGKGLGYETSSERTNERLAIFGEDFFQLKRKDFKIIREFPTGVFKDKKTRASQLLSAEYIDIISLNRYGNLAVIELKIDDSKLEVISQILNYSLFFRSYRDILIPQIEAELGKIAKKDNIFCYVVNNRYHPRFAKIKKFYQTEDKSYGFVLKQIILGYTEII